MEKVGGMLKNENLQDKGAAKRAAAGNDNDNSYGSGNNNNNY
tara:strand:- start:282 stop:407 length:126 start_codon:yes stop_codon:yes gene_type:complete